MPLKKQENEIAEALGKAISDPVAQIISGAAALAALQLGYLVRKGIAEKPDVIRRLRLLSDNALNPLERSMFDRAISELDNLDS